MHVEIATIYPAHTQTEITFRDLISKTRSMGYGTLQVAISLDRHFSSRPWARVQL